jgi:PKD repeat protein
MTRTLACSATLAAAILLLGSGCGGGPSEAPKTATTVAPSPAPTTAPAAAAPTGAGEAADEAAPLLAWAEGDPEDGNAPLTVVFKADVEGGKPPLKHTWKFGDGSPDSAEANPKHTYEKPGKYRADLSVTDSGGDSDTDYVEITVN